MCLEVQGFGEILALTIAWMLSAAGVIHLAE